MKPEELRIGNYIYDAVGGECIVRGLTKDGIWIRDNAGPGTNSAFKPIPLTYEWLDRFKFKTRKNIMNEVIHYNDMLHFSDGFICSWEMGFIGKIEYVHQLQNLFFALKGKELTIKSK